MAESNKIMLVFPSAQNNTIVLGRRHQHVSYAVGTFKLPLASVQVCKKFVWVLRGFIEMLTKNIF